MPHNLDRVLDLCKKFNIHTYDIGASTTDGKVNIQVGEAKVIESAELRDLRAVWESTSVSLERLQCENSCVDQEEQGNIMFVHTCT